MQQNVDYDKVLEYNQTTGSFIEYPGDLSQLRSEKSYYIHCLRDTSWNIEPLSRTTEFYYDGDGGRVKRSSHIDKGETTVYIGSLFEKSTFEDPDQPTATKKHIYAGANRVCTVESSLYSLLATRYFHSDHLGSSNVVTDENGTQLQLIEYSPFGEISTYQGSYDTDIRYTGKIQDDTGLYYYGARYYDPAIGRFITPDSIVQAPQDPQGLNRYSYCSNNPIKYIDPTGHFWFIPLIIAVIKGAIIGSLIGGLLAAIMGGNVGQGFLTGAISGAFFGGVGFLGSASATASGPLIKGAAVVYSHIAAGAASGAINSAITGTDVGRGALIGGISAGVAKGLSSYIPESTSENLIVEYVENTAKSSLVGAVAGGVASMATGGDFWEGFKQGATTSAIAYNANCLAAVPAEIVLAGAVFLVGSAVAFFNNPQAQAQARVAFEKIVDSLRTKFAQGKSAEENKQSQEQNLDSKGKTKEQIGYVNNKILRYEAAKMGIGGRNPLEPDPKGPWQKIIYGVGLLAKLLQNIQK